MAPVWVIAIAVVSVIFSFIIVNLIIEDKKEK